MKATTIQLLKKSWVQSGAYYTESFPAYVNRVLDTHENNNKKVVAKAQKSL